MVNFRFICTLSCVVVVAILEFNVLVILAFKGLLLPSLCVALLTVLGESAAAQ